MKIIVITVRYKEIRNFSQGLPIPYMLHYMGEYHSSGDGMRIREWIIIYCCTVVLPAWAGVPQVIHPETGQPIGWENPSDIVVSIDQGPLGKLNNTQAVALVNAMVATWNAVPGSEVQMRVGRQLDHDVTVENIAEYIDGSVCSDEFPASIASMQRGESPIIFDHDGSIIDILSGEGASKTIAGKAAYRCYRGTMQQPRHASQAFMVINGRFFDGLDAPMDLPANVYAGIILHELGHFLGLHHSVVNADLFDLMMRGEETADSSRFIPVMYPLVLRSNVANTVLKPDDHASLRTVYGEPGAEQTASLHGVIYDGDRFGVRGSNVIARRTDDPRCHAVATISGRFCTPLVDRSGMLSLLGENCAGSEAEQGAYRVEGLEPGTYTIEVDAIPHTRGIEHNVFPKTLDKTLPGHAEYYHENDAMIEADLDPTTIDVHAGVVVRELDILLAPLSEDAPILSLSERLQEPVASDCGFDRVEYDHFLAQLLPDEGEIVSVGEGDGAAQLALSDGATAAAAGGGCSLHASTADHSPSPLWLLGLLCCAGMVVRVRPRASARHLLLPAMCGVLCCVTATSSEASTSVGIDLTQLESHAATIFYGTCVSSEAYQDERGLYVRELQYDVQRAIKGAARAGKVFRFRAPASALASHQCNPAQADVVLLHGESAWGYSTPVGGAQGRMTVRIDADGQDYVRVPQRNAPGFGASKSVTRPDTPREMSPHAFLDYLEHLSQQQAP